MFEDVGSLKNISRMIRQRLCIERTIKARQPKLNGGCKSIHRLKKIVIESLEYSVRTYQATLKSSSHIINGMSVFCVLYTYLKSSTSVHILYYFVEKFFLGSVLQPAPIVPRALPLI